MSEALVDQGNFVPDAWDAAGINAESVKIAINALINSTFSVGSVSEIERNAIELAVFKEALAQNALKSAAEASAKAASFADLPESTLFKNAEANRVAYENIAKSLRSEAGQLLTNAAGDKALASKFTNTINLLGPTLNALQLGAAVSTG